MAVEKQNMACMWKILMKSVDLDEPTSFLATFPVNVSGAIPSPRTMPCRDSGLPHETRNVMGTSGNVCERPPAQEGLSSSIWNNSKNLATSSQELRTDTERNTKRPESEMRREPQHSSIPVPPFQSESGLLNHTGGTYSHSGVINYPRFPISKLHLGRFPDSMEFQSWKVNFKTEVQNQQILISQCNGSKKLRWQSQLTNSWHRDRLQGEEISPTTICLMRWLRLHWKDFSTSMFSSEKRVSVEEQCAQKYDRFLRGRQNAYIIYEHFRATGPYEAVQRLSDFFNKRLQNDDVQDLYVRWDQALSSASDTPSDVILEGLYKSKNYRTLFSFRLSWLCTTKKPFETMETSYWSRWWELETSGSGAMLWKGDHSPRVQKDRKPTLRGKWESVFSGRHMDNVPKQTHAVSVMTHSLWQQWQRSETKRTIVFSCISHPKVKQTDGEKQKSSQWSGNEEASSLVKSEIPCRFKFCKKPSCKFWHSCVKITSLKKKDAKMATNALSDSWGRRKAQQKIKERWCERISCDVEGVCSFGLCISRFLSEKIYSTWRRKLGIKTRRQVLQRHMAPNKKKNRERKVHHDEFLMSVNLMSAVLARQNSGKDHMRRPCNKKDVPAE